MSRIKAAQAASSALNELGLDQAQPIDPFVAIEEVGLELRFRPLKDLLGAVLPGEPGGVLINSARPASLQQYTAAHELGHWYMDQDLLSLDTDDLVLGHGHHEVRENDAQIFAAHFLMPLELIHPVARRYGISYEAPTSAEQAYQAARDMRVSYEAAVRQLNSVGLLSAANRNQLLRTKPAVIKRRLTDGMVLPDPRGDVWIVEYPNRNAAISTSVGDAILIRLREFTAAGYRWVTEAAVPAAPPRPGRMAPEPFDGGQAFGGSDAPLSNGIVRLYGAEMSSDVVSIIRDEIAQGTYESDVTPIGGEVTRLVAYAANAPGEESIRLLQIRPGRPDAPASSLEVTTLVRGAPEVEYRRRLLEAFSRYEEESD